LLAANNIYRVIYIEQSCPKLTHDVVNHHIAHPYRRI